MNAKEKKDVMVSLRISPELKSKMEVFAKMNRWSLNTAIVVSMERILSWNDYNMNDVTDDNHKKVK